MLMYGLAPLLPHLAPHHHRVIFISASAFTHLLGTSPFVSFQVGAKCEIHEVVWIHSGWLTFT